MKKQAYIKNKELNIPNNCKVPNQAINRHHVYRDGIQQPCVDCRGTGAKPTAYTTVIDICSICRGNGIIQIK